MAGTLPRGDGVGEGQGARAGPRAIARGPARVQGQGRRAGDVHRLAEPDGDGDDRAGAVGCVGVGRCDVVDRRGDGIDHDVLVRAQRAGRRGDRYGQDRAVGVSGDRVLDGARERRGRSRVEVAGTLPRGDGVGEGQGARAGPRAIARGPARVQGQGRNAGDVHRLTEPDVDDDDRAGAVGSVGGAGGHVGDRRGDGIDHDVLVRAQRAGRRGDRYGQDRAVGVSGDRVLDGARERRGRSRVEVAGTLPRGDGVGEGQGARAGPRAIARGPARVQGQGRRAGDVHRLAEPDGDGDDRAGAVGSVGGAGGHVVDRRGDGVDHDVLADA